MDNLVAKICDFYVEFEVQILGGWGGGLPSIV
jgi:hypothetical protein